MKRGGWLGLGLQFEFDVVDGLGLTVRVVTMICESGFSFLAASSSERKGCSEEMGWGGLMA